MVSVLHILDALCSKHHHIRYDVRDYTLLSNEIYNIDIYINDLRVVVSSSPYPHIVEVWTSNQPAEDDGVRVYMTELQSILDYIIKTTK